MAKTLYVPVNNLSSEVKKILVPVGGLSKYAVKGYCSDNGFSKLFFGEKPHSMGWRQEKNVPYDNYQGSAVVFQNKIHLLGGSNARYLHYTFDGSTWVQEQNLPFSFYNGSAITFGGKIHCIGGGGTESQYYTYDGTSWTHEADLPVKITGLNHATIYNGKLTLASSNNWTNNEWRHIATLDNGTWSVDWNVLTSDVMYSAVGYNNLIYLIGDRDTSGTQYSTWDGNSQSALSPLPVRFSFGYALEYDGKIHLLGGNGSQQNHYSFDGTTFIKELDIPYSYFEHCPAVVFKNRIHIFGSSRSSKSHWSYGVSVDIDYAGISNIWVHDQFIYDANDKIVGMQMHGRGNSSQEYVVYKLSNLTSMRPYTFTLSAKLAGSPASYGDPLPYGVFVYDTFSFVGNKNNIGDRTYQEFDVDTTKHTYTFTFTPQGSTAYMWFEFGRLADNISLTLTIEDLSVI